MHVDLDTLATALYVRVDDELASRPHLCPWRPRVGIVPKITDAEVVTLAVMQALLGYHSESRWIRYAHVALRHLFPYVPGQSGYNKRLRALDVALRHIITVLAAETGLWRDPVRLADSTPIECGRSRETVTRSALAGWAGYGYCASHSRRFWGLRLHLVTTVHGLPVAFALAHPTVDERGVLVDLIASPRRGFAHPGGLIVVVDKGYRDAATERLLNDHGVTMIRPAYRGEAPRPGRMIRRALRQTIESVNNTLKAHLDLETHGGRTGTPRS